MKQSDSVAALMQSLNAAQKEFKPVPKSKTGQEGNRRFKYADLADVVSMVTPILTSKGIFLSQPIVVDANGNTRQSTRLQYGDEFIQTDGIKLADDVPGKNLGISVTYARRIDLNGLLGIAPDEDVDAPDLTPAPTPSTSAKTQFNSKTPQKTNVSANPEITDDDLPPEMFGERVSDNVTQVSKPPLQDLDFKPLTEARNSEIQNRLKELVSDKTLDRKKLALFLDKEHSGKKQFDVSAEKWELTMRKIETAVLEGPDSVKTLLKGVI